MAPSYRDFTAGNVRRCQSPECTRLVLKPRRKCNHCRVTTGYSTVTLRPSTKGKTKRGVCLHKVTKPRTKRPKRQNPGGDKPTLRKPSLSRE